MPGHALTGDEQAAADQEFADQSPPGEWPANSAAADQAYADTAPPGVSPADWPAADQAYAAEHLRRLAGGSPGR